MHFSFRIYCDKDFVGTLPIIEKLLLLSNGSKKMTLLSIKEPVKIKDVLLSLIVWNHLKKR